MVDTLTINGRLYSEDGQPWADQTIRADLVTELATATEETILNKGATTTTDANGDWSLTLAVPPSGYWRYYFTLPKGSGSVSVYINLSAASSTDFETLLAAANLDQDVSASTLDLYVAKSEVVTALTLASAGDLPASVSAIVDLVTDNIVSGGVDTDGSPVADDFPQFVDANTLKGLTAAELKTALGLVIGSDIQAYSAVLAATTASFTAADESKLDGIEAGATADQTGAEIKAAYEGEADTNAFTDAEKTKLSGIETAATADQTGAEIKAAYEGEADTNAFTDAEKTKLSGIETAADVTDAGNVAAAGALMSSGGTMSGDLALADNTIERPVLKDVGEAATTNAASGATETLDIEDGNVFDITLSDNCTFTFSNPSASGTACSFTLILRQDGTGSRSVTWPASVDWPGGTAPTISSDASAVDVYTFLTVDGGTTWLGFTAGQAFASP